MSAAKAIAGLLVLGGLLGGGLYAGDRFAEAQAEAYARGVVSDSITTSATPVVDIKGFPFLTQLLVGTLDEVTASLDGATLEGVGVTDVRLDARAVTVRPPDGQQPSAGQATISATIAPASVETIVKERNGLVVTLGVEGSELTASGTVLGLPLVMRLAPRVDGGKLLTDVQDLTLGGRQITVQQLPTALRSRLTGIEVPVQGLPPGLRLTRAEVVPTGIRITASGTNVTLPKTAAP